MAFGLATGGTTPAVYPTGSTAHAFAANGFIPEIWEGNLLAKFYDSTVLSAISNTDYEGSIRDKGDKVRIRTRPTITIKEYLVSGALELERPEGTDITLNIDHGYYFNLILDDVMDVQSDIDAMGAWSEDAAEQMKVVIDTAVLLDMLSKADSDNKGATAGRISGDINLGATTAPVPIVARSPDVGEVEIIDMILRMGQALDEQNIPETGRWLLLPAWASTMIKMSELRQAYLSGDSVSILRNGRLGMIDRFTIYVSNLLPQGVITGPPALASGETAIYAGHSHGLTFASQISKVETLRSENTFGNILRGLQVYGNEVIDGTAIVEGVIAKA